MEAPQVQARAPQRSVYELVCNAREAVGRVFEDHLEEAQRLPLETTVVTSTREEVEVVLSELIAAVPQEKEVEDFLFLPSDDVTALRHYTSDLKSTISVYKDRLARAERSYKELFNRLNRRDADIDTIRATLLKEVCQLRGKLSGSTIADSPTECNIFDTFTGLEVEIEELHQKYTARLHNMETTHKRLVEKLRARYEAMLGEKDKEMISRQLDYRNATECSKQSHTQELDAAKWEAARLKNHTGMQI